MTGHVTYASWTSAEGLGLGDHDGTTLGRTAPHGQGLTIAAPTSSRAYADPHRDNGVALFEQATWT